MTPRIVILVLLIGYWAALGRAEGQDRADGGLEFLVLDESDVPEGFGGGNSLFGLFGAAGYSTRSNEDVARELGAVTDIRADEWLRRLIEFGRLDGVRATYVKLNPATEVIDTIVSEAELYETESGAAAAFRMARDYNESEAVSANTIALQGGELVDFRVKRGSEPTADSSVVYSKGFVTMEGRRRQFQSIQIIWLKGRVGQSVGWIVYGPSSVFESEVVALAVIQNAKTASTTPPVANGAASRTGDTGVSRPSVGDSAQAPSVSLHDLASMGKYTFPVIGQRERKDGYALPGSEKFNNAFQDWKLTCKAAVYTMIARGVGYRDAKIDEFWDHEDGAIWNEAAVRGATGVTVTFEPDPSVDENAKPIGDFREVVRALQAGHPVMIHGIVRGDPPSHWMLATAVTPKGLVANDPWTKRQVTIDLTTGKIIDPSGDQTDFTTDAYIVVNIASPSRASIQFDTDALNPSVAGTTPSAPPSLKPIGSEQRNSLADELIEASIAKYYNEGTSCSQHLSTSLPLQGVEIVGMKNYGDDRLSVVAILSVDVKRPDTSKTREFVYHTFCGGLGIGQGDFGNTRHLGMRFTFANRRGAWLITAADSSLTEYFGLRSPFDTFLEDACGRARRDGAVGSAEKQRICRDIL